MTFFVNKQEVAIESLCTSIRQKVGYIGKLTIKNWAKLAKASTDTAERDVKYLTQIGILTPQQGKVRNVSYGINVSESLLLVPGPAEED